MMQAETIIKEADITDAAAIFDLQRIAYQSEARLYEGLRLPPLSQTLEELRESFADHLFLKAVIGVRIVGSVRACEKRGACHIGRLIVHPGYRRQGIGTLLMAEIEKRFPRVARFELFTGEKSADNIRLYNRLGYRETVRKAVSGSPGLVFLGKTNNSRP